MSRYDNKKAANQKASQASVADDDPIALFAKANSLQKDKNPDARIAAMGGGEHILASNPMLGNKLLSKDTDGVMVDVFENSKDEDFSEVVRFLLLDKNTKDPEARIAEATDIFVQLKILADNCNVTLLTWLPDKIAGAMAGGILDLSAAPKDRTEDDEKRGREFGLFCDVLGSDTAERLKDKAEAKNVSNRSAFIYGLKHLLVKDSNGITRFGV